MHNSNGVILNLYPDSIGGKLSNLAMFLHNSVCKDVFSYVYILPSIFNSDLDRGFSIIDYSLNKLYATEEDLHQLSDMGIQFKYDFVLNHASVLSRPFQDLLEKGDASEYRDFFIDWNKFWQGYGELGPDGYIQPYDWAIQDMFFRKPELPVLDVLFPDGSTRYYWNTFYQKIYYDSLDAQDLLKILQLQYHEAEALSRLINDQLAAGIRARNLDLGQWEQHRVQLTAVLEKRRKYLGQMDLNIKSEKVWEFYRETLNRLSKYGASIIRLDAFAYAPKAPCSKNFLNEPDTWELLERISSEADKHGLRILPEIHAAYSEKIHERISSRGYLCYDFFLPGLILHAIETRNSIKIRSWAQEIVQKGIRTINMLGCHDGIPLLDLRGILTDGEIDYLSSLVISRGGLVKDLHGKKNMYYQINATYFSALGEDPKKMLMARAIQLMMPGQSQIWYLDLFGGKNDYEAVRNGGSAAHKEINRTNLSMERIEAALQEPLFREQLALIHMRNTHPVFSPAARCFVHDTSADTIKIEWENGKHSLVFNADLEKMDFTFDMS